MAGLAGQSSTANLSKVVARVGHEARLGLRQDIDTKQLSGSLVPAQQATKV